MTRDELLALVASCLAHRPQKVEGGVLFCHTPDVAELAYLGRVYDPIPASRALAWFAEAGRLENPYFSVVTEVANGLRIANLSLCGVIEHIDRSDHSALGQPICLRHGNVFERPPNLDDTDLVIGSIVGWSSKGAFVMGHNGEIRLVHPSNGADVADAWASLAEMLRAELGRIAGLHDPEGREISTATQLMHPNGRRWETEVEPGTARH